MDARGVQRYLEGRNANKSWLSGWGNHLSNYQGHPAGLFFPYDIIINIPKMEYTFICYENVKHLSEAGDVKKILTSIFREEHTFTWYAKFRDQIH